MIARTGSSITTTILSKDSACAKVDVGTGGENEEAVTFYHGTTVSNARNILKQGPNSNEFYVTPHLFEARTYAFSKSLQERFTAHEGDYDPRMCTLKVMPRDGEPFRHYHPAAFLTSHGALIKPFSPAVLETVDMSTNANHVFLTQSGFDKCVVSPVNPGRLLGEGVNPREDMRVG